MDSGMSIECLYYTFADAVYGGMTEKVEGSTVLKSDRLDAAKARWWFTNKKVLNLELKFDVNTFYKWVKANGAVPRPGDTISIDLGSASVSFYVIDVTYNTTDVVMLLAKADDVKALINKAVFNVMIDTI